MESPKKKAKISKVYHDLDDFISYAKDFKSFKFTVQSFEGNMIKGTFQLCPDFSPLSSSDNLPYSTSSIQLSDSILESSLEYSRDVSVNEEGSSRLLDVNSLAATEEEMDERNHENNSNLSLNHEILTNSNENSNNSNSELNFSNLIPISYSLNRKIRMENFLMSNEFEQFCLLLKLAIPCKNNQFPDAFEYYNKKLAPLINQEKLNCSLISSIIKTKTGVELSSKRLNIWRKNSPKKIHS